MGSSLIKDSSGSVFKSVFHKSCFSQCGCLCESWNIEEQKWPTAYCHFTKRVKYKCLPSNTTFWERQSQQKIAMVPEEKVWPWFYFLIFHWLMKSDGVQGWEPGNLDSSLMGHQACFLLYFTRKKYLSCLENQPSLFLPLQHPWLPHSPGILEVLL